ncbi:hypothetical protein [Mariniflexile jejuense]|uniref:hypothetical protein n=1 Tax=Mariniflexile jejuense TaxID=1173582 RepID=UPI0036D30045
MKYTKYGLINALLSLIPIFPTLTLFPGVITAMAIENTVNSCETSYFIVLWSSIILTIVITALFLLRLDKKTVKTKKKEKINFGLLSLLIYTLINTAGLILILGTDLACHGDGQTILACLLSGPIASLFIIVLGLISDLKIKITSVNSV